MSIRDDLTRIGAIDSEFVEQYAMGTRDNPNLEVLWDRESGVIFIPESDVARLVYEEGEYRQTDTATSYQDHVDTRRRIREHRELYQDKHVMDFGCGFGSFLRASRPYARSVMGVELQDSCRAALQTDNINCTKYVDDIDDESVDTVFMFHVLEHLAAPLDTLEQLRRKLRPGGRLVAEVPSANDFLLTHIGGEPFRQFTLWSQHLVLHTRDSLQRLVRNAPFSIEMVSNIQRYPLSNHFGWIKTGRPGGHIKEFNLLNDAELQREYARVLAERNMTDTLVLVAVAS